MSRFYRQWRLVRARGIRQEKRFNRQEKRANTFSKMMTRGIKQSDKIIVEECGVGRFYAKYSIYNRIHFEHQNISEVYIRTADGLELLYKKGEG